MSWFSFIWGNKYANSVNQYANGINGSNGSTVHLQMIENINKECMKRNQSHKDSHEYFFECTQPNPELEKLLRKSGYEVEFREFDNPKVKGYNIQWFASEH
jgi:hypothetical protein